MSKFCRAFLIAGLGLASVVSTSAYAQTSTTKRLAKHIDRMDFALQGAYVSHTSVNGTNYLNQKVDQSVSTTFGALVQLRYTKSPLVGFEFNWNYSRSTQTYVRSNANTLTVQSTPNEFTLGYVYHGPEIAGIKTFASAGAGATEYKPTRYGGVGLQPQARATYYYGFGGEMPVFTPNIGVRVQFRQAFHKAPDFGQNYLTIQKQNMTIEPAFGFYVHF
ncbi:hypothetical protein [Terriglobus albidus]|uniref:hypothetical protein n=1 Tax=Terriglobus albidus TaxID=1592106 RepID=UPI0021E0C8D3|nr:hypothetical protein [Terriglobus albidus]